MNIKATRRRMRTRSRNAPAPKVSGWVSEANCEAGPAQIWAALLTHLIMRYIKFKSRAVCSYSRFVAFIRAVTWLKRDLMQSLWFYGIAPPPENQVQLENAPYLPGFEKMFARSMG